MTPKDVVARLAIARLALEVYPKSFKAKQAQTEMSDRLIRLVLEQNRMLLVKDTAESERIALEAAKIASQWVPENSTLLDQLASARRSAYPRLKLRVIANDSESCKNKLPDDRLMRIIGEALTPVATIDKQQWDLTLSIRNLGCTVTDLPKLASESKNSTYVAGHNQLANPRYEDLQQQLSAAQAELNRAIYQNSINPNFGTGFAVGWWRGKVNQLQKGLRDTPPYITQDIIQQYTYDAFQAYRASQIEAQLQLSGKSSEQQYLTRNTVSELAEGRGEGTSGVLPTDNTGIRNAEPLISPIDTYVRESIDGFHSKLQTKVRELIAGYFATAAMDAKSPSPTRLSAMLYLTDIAAGTQYEAQREKLDTVISEVLLQGFESSANALSSVNLPVPEQLAANDTDATSNSAESMLVKTIEGVLAIETDNGNEGSGFFVTTGCLVVTNRHVIEGAETIVLKTSSRRLFTAQILAKDDGRDLALLRSNARSCSPLTLEDSDNAAIGQEVYAIGNPLGLSSTVTRGIVSAWRNDNNGVRYIQLDASVNPGNSGVPLVSRTGRVLGVNTFKVRGFEGLNFAVASSEIKKAFERFVQ